MKTTLRIIVLLLIFSLLFAGCRKTAEPESETDDNAAIADVTIPDDDMDMIGEPGTDDAIDQTTGQPQSNGNSGSSQSSSGGSGTGGNSGGNSGESPGGDTGTGSTTPQPDPPPAPDNPDPPKPSVSISNVMTSAISQVGAFMTHGNGTADGMGYLDLGISATLSEDKIIADIVGVFRQEADLYGNTHFDLAYLGEYNGEYNFRFYRA